MKKLLLLLALINTIHNELRAQYNPMLGDTTKWCIAWNVIMVTRIFENNYYTAMTDTIYDSLSYKKVFDDLGYYGAIREDTANQQIFFIKNTDTVEHLLYDFSLNLGEMFLVDLYNNMYGNLNDGFYTVDSVSYVNIRGGLRKYIRLHNPMNTTLGGDGQPLKLEWIESVGDIHNTFYTYGYDDFGYGPLQWSCNNYHSGAVMKQTINTSKNYIDVCTATNVFGDIGPDTCAIAYWSNIDELNNLIHLSVFPNPNNGNSIAIDVNNYKLKGNCTITISDATGRSVYNKSISKTGNSITINDFIATSGIYFITLLDDSNIFGKAKLVVEK